MWLDPRYFIFFMLSYILGSIPFSVWIGKLWYGIDIRQHGSGNAGATNTFRVLGKKAGVIVLILDVLKGYLAVFLPVWLGLEHAGNIRVVCGLISVLGHVYSVFLNFKGGKGVATSLGVMVALAPLATISSAIVFLVLWRLSAYISLSSIISSIVFPIFHLIWHNNASKLQWSVVVLMPLIILYTHRSNIKRLIRGNENKISMWKSKK